VPAPLWDALPAARLAQRGRSKGLQLHSCQHTTCCAGNGGDPNASGTLLPFQDATDLKTKKKKRRKEIKKEQIPYFCIKCKALFPLCLCTHRGMPGWQGAGGHGLSAAAEAGRGSNKMVAAP